MVQVDADVIGRSGKQVEGILSSKRHGRVKRVYKQNIEHHLNKNHRVQLKTCVRSVLWESREGWGGYEWEVCKSTRTHAGYVVLEQLGIFSVN